MKEEEDEANVREEGGTLVSHDMVQIIFSEDLEHRQEEEKKNCF